MTRKYEGPSFKFQEMRLLERVADECWGTGTFWFDMDGNGKVDAATESLPISVLGLGPNGCNGNNAAKAINEYAETHYKVKLGMTASDCNTKNPRFMPSYS